ncbi:MAG: hypothetical protein ACOYT4_00010 [Nanoarchaeota archaeon]
MQNPLVLIEMNNFESFSRYFVLECLDSYSDLRDKRIPLPVNFEVANVPSYDYLKPKQMKDLQIYITDTKSRNKDRIDKVIGSSPNVNIVTVALNGKKAKSFSEEKNIISELQFVEMLNSLVMKKHIYKKFNVGVIGSGIFAPCILNQLGNGFSSWLNRINWYSESCSRNNSRYESILINQNLGWHALGNEPKIKTFNELESLVDCDNDFIIYATGPQRNYESYQKLNRVHSPKEEQEYLFSEGLAKLKRFCEISKGKNFKLIMGSNPIGANLLYAWENYGIDGIGITPEKYRSQILTFETLKKFKKENIKNDEDFTDFTDCINVEDILLEVFGEHHNPILNNFRFRMEEEVFNAKEILEGNRYHLLKSEITKGVSERGVETMKNVFQLKTGIGESPGVISSALEASAFYREYLSLSNYQRLLKRWAQGTGYAQIPQKPSCIEGAPNYDALKHLSKKEKDLLITQINEQRELVRRFGK